MTIYKYSRAYILQTVPPPNLFRKGPETAGMFE